MRSTTVVIQLIPTLAGDIDGCDEWLIEDTNDSDDVRNDIVSYVESLDRALGMRLWCWGA